jgi:hypothetical protein
LAILQAAPGSSRSISSLAVKCGVLLLLGFAALNAGMIWRVRDSMLQGYGDFASFYTAGQIVRSGQSARLYDPALQWKVQQQFASSVEIRRGPLPYIRPPFEALLFLPFAYLSYPAACVLWTVLNFVLLLTVPFLLPRSDPDGVGTSTYAVESVVCLAFFPVAFDLLQGQDSVLLLLILVLALRLLLRGSDSGCGAILALGMFKFHLMIPLLAILILRLFVRKKKSRALLGFLAGFLATASVLFVVSLLMVHWSGLLAYPKYLWGLNQASELGMVKPQTMPNVRGLMTLFLGNGPLPAGANWFLGGIVALGIIVASKSWRGDDCRGDDYRSTSVAFSFSVVVTLATSYYANSYDLTLLLLPLFLLGKTFLRGSEISGWPRILFLAAAGVLLCTPFAWILALRVNQFCWMAVVLFALATSIFAAGRSWRTH